MFTVKINKDDVTHEKWAEILKSLELPEGRDEVIVTRIPGLQAIDNIPDEPFKIESEIKKPEEWLFAEGIDGKRQWVIHTHSPRFICEIVDDEDDTFNPPFEYETSDGQWLCNFLWYDAPPEDITIICAEAEDALKAYDEILGVD